MNKTLKSYCFFQYDTNLKSLSGTNTFNFNLNFFWMSKKKNYKLQRKYFKNKLYLDASNHNLLLSFIMYNKWKGIKTK